MDKVKLRKVIELGIVQKENNKRFDQVDQFIEYILSKPKGLYLKKDIENETGITNLRRVLRDARIIELFPQNANKIIIHRSHIEVL